MDQSILILIMLGMLPSAGLNAQQTTRTTLAVTARLEESCKVTAPDLALGKYTAQRGAPSQAKLALSVTCTPDTTYSVGVNKGTTHGATGGQQKVASGAQDSNNRRYSDSARSAIPGNTIGTENVTGVGTGMEVNHTLFGGIPASQVVQGGDYADTITVRVHY